jgi:hypothetical protein
MCGIEATKRKAQVERIQSGARKSLAAVLSKFNQHVSASSSSSDLEDQREEVREEEIGLLSPLLVWFNQHVSASSSSSDLEDRREEVREEES